MPALKESPPKFAENLSAFLSYLEQKELLSGISPQRLCLALDINLLTLAQNANVPYDIVVNTPADTQLQSFLQDVVRVISMSADVSMDVDKSIAWFTSSCIPCLDHKSPQTLVSKGRTRDVIRYLQSLDAGWSG